MSDEENNNTQNETPSSSADSGSGNDPTADAPPLPPGKPARMYSEGKRFPKNEANTEEQQGDDKQDISE